MNPKLSKADEERYARAAEWAESIEEIPADANVVDATVNQDGRRLMEDLLGSPEAVERAMGRPSVDGSMSAGHSPVRQVRLSRELDDLLTARAQAEHRRRSEIIREALDTYLRSA
ncbi:ribbon-helix-helix domain-containing protein [Leifsonia sp. AG29]|uniref:ribbon-helix-helix domain-containing protein n=1 Tax=Leifsonia sp. AG29 TaxID=2598860 RepID=UPI00131DE9AF|nr:ribbon-helix-helix domain-containing protein [Leifsonia sp. AG29]